MTAGPRPELAALLAGETGRVDRAGDLSCVDVEPVAWRATAHRARDAGLTYLDWLTGVDDGSGGVQVVMHLLDPDTMARLLVRTTVPAGALRVDSITAVYAGAAWHERETAEMFGIDVIDHPGLAPLLLPTEFRGHPLRKEFVLAARAVKVWPGATEPGASGPPPPGRARRGVRPLGVPDAGTWGRDA